MCTGIDALEEPRPWLDTKLNHSAPSIDTLKESRPWSFNTASLSQVSMLWKSLVPGYTKLNHSAPSIDTLKESRP